MTPADEHFRKLERMFHAAPINRFFEPVLRVSEGKAEITVPIKPDFFHAANAVHGSVYFKALDDAAFFAANSLVSDVFVLTVTYTVYLTRPISEGAMRATGRVVHRSKSLIIADAELLDSSDRQIARGSGTFMRSQIPLSPAIGYE
ncbi:MAG TPA: PaaI family thioesterase [Gemmatimonadaceae bacterium]|nr:PaaI family thioesterase [Gemmatimonadaceae bacterium]